MSNNTFATLLRPWREHHSPSDNSHYVSVKNENEYHNTYYEYILEALSQAGLAEGYYDEKTRQKLHRMISPENTLSVNAALTSLSRNAPTLLNTENLELLASVRVQPHASYIGLAIDHNLAGKTTEYKQQVFSYLCEHPELAPTIFLKIRHQFSQLSSAMEKYTLKHPEAECRSYESLYHELLDGLLDGSIKDINLFAHEKWQKQIMLYLQGTSLSLEPSDLTKLSLQQISHIACSIQILLEQNHLNQNTLRTLLTHSDSALTTCVELLVLTDPEPVVSPHAHPNIEMFHAEDIPDEKTDFREKIAPLLPDERQSLLQELFQLLEEGFNMACEAFAAKLNNLIEQKNRMRSTRVSSHSGGQNMTFFHNPSRNEPPQETPGHPAPDLKPSTPYAPSTPSAT